MKEAKQKEAKRAKKVTFKGPPKGGKKKKIDLLDDNSVWDFDE